MRVFLCGAQGTGKSTLVNNLPDDLGLKKKDSFSKDFLAKDPSIQTRKSEHYDEFQDKIILYCLDEYINDDNFVSSRSIVDTYAYLEANDANRKQSLYGVIDHFMRYLLKDDDIYIYLPIEFELSSKGNSNRALDKEYQKQVDTYMRSYFEKLSGLGRKDQFIVLKGDRETRLQKLIDIIKQKK